MGTYVESNLTNGETVTYEGKVSVWSMLPLILLGVLLLPLWGIGVFFWIVAFIRYATTEIAITNKRIIAKFGLIRRSTIELNLNKVESIQIYQSILGRLTNYGSIIAGGGGSAHTPVPGISNPLNFRKAFIAAQEDATGTATV